MVMFIARAFADEPFDRVDTNRVVRVVVGYTQHMGDPWADTPKPPQPLEFKKYFELDDAKLAKKLAGFVKDMKKTDEMTYPFIGILSEQKFMDSTSNVVFTTHIVNYEATVVIDPLPGFNKDCFRNGSSVEFCRIIYDLMNKHCPKVIEEQNSLYRKGNRSLEELLFGNKGKMGTTIGEKRLSTKE